MTLFDADRFDGGVAGGETLLDGELERGRRASGPRRLLGASKSRPPPWGMTFVVGVLGRTVLWDILRSEPEAGLGDKVGE